MSTMLSSWKEIAQFFGKGVRTVQRWEKTLSLPIQRPPGAPSNVVLARTSDLEAWMHRSESAAPNEMAVKTSTDLQNSIQKLEMELRRLEEAIGAVTVTSAEAESANTGANTGSVQTRLDAAVTQLHALVGDVEKTENGEAEDRSLSAVVKHMPWPSALLDARMHPVICNSALRSQFGSEWVSTLESQPFPGPLGAEIGRQMKQTQEKRTPSIYYRAIGHGAAGYGAAGPQGISSQEFDLHINPIAMEDDTVGLLLIYAPHKARVRSRIAA